MNQKVYLIFDRFDTGGLQTLMVRIAEWCNLHNIESLIIYNKCDDNMHKLCIDKGIKYFPTFNKKKMIKLLEEDSRKYDLTLITFELPQFLYIENLRTNYLKNNRINHFIYNVSVTGMIFGSKMKSYFSRKLIYNFYRKLIQNYINNNQVFFMDRETLESHKEYYLLDINDVESKILRLPMNISKLNKMSINKRIENKKFNITTVTRASFPYKGYVIGLIDDFAQLRKEYSNVFLTIISFGQDIDILKEKINQQRKEVRNSILLIGKSDQGKINNILDKSNLYIGMGTTLLDAANYSVPSIISYHSTFENLSSGYFNEYPDVLSRSKMCHNSYDLIKNVLNLNKDEYFKMSVYTYLKYEELYNIDNIMPKIINIKNKKYFNNIKSYEWIWHKFLFKIRLYRRKIFKLK